MQSASTLHLHREPCSEQQAQFLACPSLPPTVKPYRIPCCRSQLGCSSSCAVGVDAALPQGALPRTSGPVFGLPYLPSHSWALPNPLLSITIGFPIILCGRRRRCTSTGSPAQNSRPSFWPPLPSPHSWALGNPLLSIKTRLPIILCGQRRRCNSTGSPAKSIRPSFWPALLSPPQLRPRKPPIFDHNWVAHHPVRSASTLHLQREPCSEHQAQFFACPTPPQLSPMELPIVDLNWVAHHPVQSASTLHLHREPCSEHQAQFFACPTPPTVKPYGTPYCRFKLGCPSSCVVGVDAAPSQGALLRISGPVFGLPYPPLHSWALGNPLLSIRIGLPIILCGQRRQCTSTGSPAQNIRPPFFACPTLPPTVKP